MWSYKSEHRALWVASNAARAHGVRLPAAALVAFEGVKLVPILRPSPWRSLWLYTE